MVKPEQRMYRILIVDDEIIERRCISFILNGSNYPIEIDEEENGQKAYDKLKQKKYDILFSDVKMPFMDGIELAEKARGLYPDIKIIMFSGYSEFEYARSAMRIGCMDYILKPVNPEAFLQFIGKIIAQIEEEEKKSEIIHIEQKYVQEHFFWKLLNGVSLAEEELYFLKKLGLSYNRLLLVEYQKDFFDCDNIEFTKEMKKYIQVEFCYVNIASNQTILFMKDSGFSVDYTMVAKNLQEGIQKSYGEASYIAVSRKFKDLTEVGAVYSELEKSMEERFFFPSLTIITEETLNCAHSYSMTSKDDIFKKINESILRKDEIAVKRLWMILNESIIGLGCSQIYIKHMLSSVALHLYDSLNEKPIDSFFDESFVEEIYMATGLGDILRKVYDLIERVCEEWSKESYVQNRVIKDIVKYIYEHFNQNIGLEVLADIVNMDASYLSRLFKKEIKVNISRFIKNVRMEKAKYLLSNTNHKVNKISQMVGYNNLSYFCQCFREYYGISPEKYRIGGGKIDD